MSVPGLEGQQQVELTLMGERASGGSAPFLSEQGFLSTERDMAASRESPHIRFEIEDVEEPHVTSDPQRSVTSNADVTFGYNTAEALPMTVYYRHASEDDGRHRPSLEHLRDGRVEVPVQDSGPVEEADGDADTPPAKKWWQFWKRSKNKQPPKFGWIRGVLVRCLLNIWGVMLFIRLSWVVGQAGVGLASVIILLSAVVTTITTISMSAICTNGEVKGGGAYYLISRSLGPQFGGAIGIIFSLANAVAVALYVVGFAETVSDLVLEYVGSPFTGSDPTNDIRVVGFCLVTLLLVIALIGLDWEAKVQLLLLFILIVAVIDIFVGSFISYGPTSQKHLRGFTGYSAATFTENFGTSYQRFEGVDQSFFTIFAVFFPAATGILAGANISGDLKNPQTAIPKGTFLAIAISTVVYLIMAWLVGFVVIRNAPGEDIFSGLINSSVTCMNQTILPISTMGPGEGVCGVEPFNFSLNFPACNSTCGPTVECIYGDSSGSDLALICSPGFLNLVNRTACEYGLLNNFQVVEMISGFGPLVTAGIFAATISSALASLVSAPKVFQRVCQDKIFPLIHVFAKGGGRSGTEPIRAYLLTYVIALACIAIGNLNEISFIISNFFLMAYALINYSCFAGSFAKSPGWRPAFKLYNKWVALLGAALCLVIMFVIRWYYALVTVVLVAALYTLVGFLKPDINWGSSTQAFLYSYSMRNLLKLEKLEEHVKNFRPQFLLLTGPPSSRPDMIHFFSHISKEVGVMVCGQVLLGDYTDSRWKLLSQSNQQKRWLRREKVKAFHNIVTANTIRQGARNLLQLSGLGKLRPNTLVVGFKSNWTNCSNEDVEEYVSTLHDAFDLQFGVVIFRLRAGFDATERIEEKGAIPDPQPPVLQPSPTPPLPPESGLRMRARGSDVGHPLLGEHKHSKEFIDIPLVPSDGSVPVVSSPHRSLGAYQPILEDLDDVASVDSYTMALEGDRRLVFDDELIEPVPPSPPHEDEVEPVQELITMPSRFENVQEKGYIDVWWLYDDGGLALLLPYLLSCHKHWKKCKLRVFTGGSSRQVNKARLRMTSLLRKFRINYSAVIEITGIGKKPSQESIDKYMQLPLDGSDSLDDKNLDKLTLRHIRLGELLHEHSSESRLIAITISVPQRTTSARRYMSWLEVMSQDLPPTLLMRGNQTSVLTFYS